MPNYAAGQIYKVICQPCNKRVYVGSTVTSLTQRMRVHVAKFRPPETKSNKSCAAATLIAAGNAEIVLHEPAPCETARELAVREELVRRELIQQGYDVVNRSRAVMCIHFADPKLARKCAECRAHRVLNK